MTHDNPPVGTTTLGPFVIHVRRRDHRLADGVGMTPECLAVARQPLGHGFTAFDLCMGTACEEPHADLRTQGDNHDDHD